MKPLPFFTFLFLFLLGTLFSCSSSPELLSNVSREELWNQVQKITTDVELVVTTKEEDRVKCGDYSAQCQNAFRLRVGLVKMILLQFTDTQTAHDEAIKLNQYHYRNWVFDEVRGEPYLEKLLQKAFGEQLNAVNSSPPKKE
jgi:hypothetical protein